MSKRGALAALIVLYLSSAAVCAQTRATVRSSGARLLKSPGNGGDILRQLPEGQEIVVEDLFSDKEWTRVKVGKADGWVRRKRIRVKMDDPWRSAAWLLIGSTPKTNGFIVRLYLNTTQVVRYGDNVRFWTKMVPDKKKEYLNFIMEKPPSNRSSDFRFNSDLWEGDCSSGELDLVRSLLYWSSSRVTKPKIAAADTRSGKNTAARVILREACRSAER